MYCPSCGQPLQQRGRFCPRCGSAIPDVAPGKRSRWWMLAGAMVVLVVLTGVLWGVYGRSGRLTSRQVADLAPSDSSTTLPEANIRRPLLDLISQTRTLASVQDGEPTSTTAPTPVPSSTPWPSMTSSPSPSVSPSATPTLTASAMPSLTMSPTSTPAPTLTSSPTVRPTCALGVAPQMASGYDAEAMGCPTGPVRTIWAAWQWFERGAMLWRSDTQQLTVLASGGSHTTYPDQWSGQAVSLSAPQGLIAPVRGFGWLWSQSAGVADALGWGTEDEKGFCLQVQEFEQGILLLSTTDGCSDEYNRARDADFRVIRVRMLNLGSWTGW